VSYTAIVVSLPYRSTPQSQMPKPVVLFRHRWGETARSERLELCDLIGGLHRRRQSECTLLPGQNQIASLQADTTDSVSERRLNAVESGGAIGRNRDRLCNRVHNGGRIERKWSRH
jgi:hypothetical protein